jgi:hypothetical protein
MNGRSRFLAFIVLAFLPFAAGGAIAQTSTSRATPEFLATLKPGQWIQLEGAPQRDGSILCTEVKLLTGDFIDDDWAIRGTTRNINPQTREFNISRYRIRLKHEVEYDDEGSGKFKGFSDIRPNLPVKVQGTYMKDGSFLAKEVNDMTIRTARKPGSETKLLIVGKVEGVSPSKRTITAMGSTFVIGQQTKLKSVLK